MEGEGATAFCMPDSEGKEYCLGDFNGKRAILCFYPEDNPNGCSREPIGFCEKRDEIA